MESFQQPVQKSKNNESGDELQAVISDSEKLPVELL